MITAQTLAVLILRESTRLIAWAAGQLEVGDTRKGTQRDLGGLLSLDAAVRAFTASRSLDVPSLPAGLIPARVRQLPLVAKAALRPSDEFVARSISLAVSVSFDQLLGLSDERVGRVLALTVVTSSFRMSAAGRKVLCETAAGEAERLRVETATAAGVLKRIAVAASATGRDHETFLYSGPIDGRTRPFCAERVGRVFSRKTIDAMDNGQLPNVYLTCGGHQCRHTWLPIPHGDVYEGLVDSGRFVEPGYAEDVARCARGACPGPAAWHDPPKRRSGKKGERQPRRLVRRR